MNEEAAVRKKIKTRIRKQEENRKWKSGRLRVAENRQKKKKTESRSKK